jgi:hypothetical protein
MDIDAQSFIQQICNSLRLPLLPSYIHLTFLDLFICQLIYISLGPRLSTFFFPNHYHGRLDSAQKLDWDIHLTAFSQTTLIFGLGCWVMLFDEERRRMTWQERVWGWTNPTATALAIANGYFLWHLVMMVRYRKLYGWSMVAHAVSVVSIMILGFVSIPLSPFPPNYVLYSTMLTKLLSSARHS